MSIPDSRDYSLSRATLLTEGYKGLLIINGGGAAALLAFIAQIINKSPEIAKLSFVGVSLMAVGLACASLIPFFRYHHSHKAEELQNAGHKGSTKTNFWYLYTGCQYLSVIVFIIALMYLAINALPIIETLSVNKNA